jgi:hypothetical protein
MNHDHQTSYSAELFYPTLPRINGADLANALQERAGLVDLLIDQEDLHLFAFPQYVTHFEGTDIPTELMLTVSAPNQHNADLEPALQQSWRWREARAAVSACPVSLTLVEMLAQGVDYRIRLTLFNHALEAVLSIAPCQALLWTPSQQFIPPAQFLEARRSKDFHPLLFGLNIRFYRISNGHPGEKLMDTMGLAALGLPDLQCHFVRLDPNQVARVLSNSAYYLYDRGDVVKDGNTIQGIVDTDRWHCRHETSLMPPQRMVLDLDPGATHAAGKRT